jgi:hypothetical protein
MEDTFFSAQLSSARFVGTASLTSTLGVGRSTFSSFNARALSPCSKLRVQLTPRHSEAATVSDQDDLTEQNPTPFQTGVVTSVRMEKSTGYKILDDAALNAFRQWRFKPARRANFGCPSHTRCPPAIGEASPSFHSRTEVQRSGPSAETTPAKSAIARAPSPAREARALPDHTVTTARMRGLG